MTDVIAAVFQIIRGKAGTNYQTHCTKVHEGSQNTRPLAPTVSIIKDRYRFCVGVWQPLIINWRYPKTVWLVSFGNRRMYVIWRKFCSSDTSSAAKLGQVCYYRRSPTETTIFSHLSYLQLVLELLHTVRWVCTHERVKCVQWDQVHEVELIERLCTSPPTFLIRQTNGTLSWWLAIFLCPGRNWISNETFYVMKCSVYFFLVRKNDGKSGFG